MRLVSTLVFAIAMVGITVPGMAQQHNRTPNIVFILADDFGYSSLNSYGADKNLVRTPHIDRIAEEGMRFTNASTPASICTPTRYGFLTGRYPWRSSLKYGVTHPLGALLPEERLKQIKEFQPQLYNLAKDPGEKHNLYDEKPEMVRQLRSELNRIRLAESSR